jgi:taurine--2-oxoglutarate transaminase
MLIADEVLSGFGRTGRWFAVDHEGVTPDLLTMAKGLTGGYAPGGAVLVTDRIARHFDDEVLWCGLTSYGHPLVCAAIVAAIESYRDEGLIDRAAELGRWLGPRLAELASGRAAVGEVRGIGLLWALELVDPAAEPGARVPLAPARMASLAASLRRRHLHMHKRDNLLYLAPPLVIRREELDEALGELMAALDETLR